MAVLLLKLIIITNLEFLKVGIGASTHQSYEHNVCLDYASEYTPEGGNKTQN